MWKTRLLYLTVKLSLPTYLVRHASDTTCMSRGKSALPRLLGATFRRLNVR